MLSKPSAGDCSATLLEQIENEEEDLEVQVIDPELRSEVAQANEELRDRMRDLEQMLLRFGSQQQLLSSGGSTACSLLLEMLGQVN